MWATMRKPFGGTNNKPKAPEQSENSRLWRVDGTAKPHSTDRASYSAPGYTDLGGSFGRRGVTARDYRLYLVLAGDWLTRDLGVFRVRGDHRRSQEPSH